MRRALGRPSTGGTRAVPDDPALFKACGASDEMLMTARRAACTSAGVVVGSVHRRRELTEAYGTAARTMQVVDLRCR